MKKRVLSLLLTGMMILSMGIGVYADTPPTDGMNNDHEINAWIQNLKDVSSKD